ncbi:MAG TPA: DUF3566 domain-containing protein [Acidothermaceae bacterium]
MSDSDLGGRPARSPYARPDPVATAEPPAALVESVPDRPADTDEHGPATVLSAPVPAASAPTGWGGAAAAGSMATKPADSGGLVGSGGDGGLAAPVRSKAVQVAVARRGPRRARLVIKHIDPWTVLKISFVVSIVMLAVIVIAVAVIYAVLGRMGVWTQINTLVNEVSPTTTSSTLHNPVSAGRVVGVAAVIGAINVVLLTALSTLGAAIYNLISDLVGGVEVTLTDP